MSDTLAAEIGARVVARRRALGLSQKQLADRIGLTQAIVSRWESGVRGCPNAESLVALAAGLETTVGWLLGEDGGDFWDGYAVGWDACRAAVVKAAQPVRSVA